MSQHFLLSSAAKTLSLASVFRMTDAEAETTFRQGPLDRYRWRARFASIAAGSMPTIAAVRRVRRASAAAPAKRISASRPARCSPATSCRLRGYLAAIAIFCNEVKGKSALALSRDLGVSYKCAFVLLHKLREAMAEEMKGRTIGGEGKVAEVDGGYFGGYVKPANHREDRNDRRLAGTRPASARSSSSSASATAIRSRPCSARKAKPSHSSRLASPRAPSSMPTKPRHGMSFTAASK